MKGFASALLELFSKTSKFEKRKGIYNNGIDNNYPEIVVSRIENSVTATRCKNTMATFISGKGFGDDLNKIVVNKFKGITLLQFTQDIADSIAEHNGVYIHINYNAEYEHSSFEVLPFTDCRVGKKDDNDHNAKIHVCKDWGNDLKAKKARKVDVYNPDKKVIESQVKESVSIKTYNGQILFFKFGKYTYPLAPIHPCLDDADSEKQASTYKNTSLRKGFFGKTLVVTPPLVEPSLDPDSDNEIEQRDYNRQKSERETFRKTIQEFVGADNADGVMHMEMELASEKMEDTIMFKNIESNIDDKLFAHTESTVSENICMAYGIPPMLIRNNDTALFSASGEAYIQMKKFYQNQTNDERMAVEQIINKLMKNFSTPQTDLKIIPIVEEEVTTQTIPADANTSN